MGIHSGLKRFTVAVYPQYVPFLHVVYLRPTFYTWCRYIIVEDHLTHITFPSTICYKIFQKYRKFGRIVQWTPIYLSLTSYHTYFITHINPLSSFNPSITYLFFETASDLIRTINKPRWGWATEISSFSVASVNLNYSDYYTWSIPEINHFLKSLDTQQAMEDSQRWMSSLI